MKKKKILKIVHVIILIILRNQKLYKNILVYDISYKTLIGAKPLRIRLDKVDWFIGVYNGIIYLVI